jgi:hypothetical protein
MGEQVTFPCIHDQPWQPMGKQVTLHVYSDQPTRKRQHSMPIAYPVPTKGGTGNIPHLRIQDQPMGKQVIFPCIQDQPIVKQVTFHAYSEPTNGGRR